jgi:DNA-binding GntR family transcriptional regulator
MSVRTTTIQKRRAATAKKRRRNAAGGGGESLVPLADGTAALTLAERVYRLLRRDIIRGALQPGEALNEKVLAARYQGSRTPLREAIMRLQQESLVRIMANKGYFVAHLTIPELNEMYEFRTALESLCAELAARRWTDEALMDRLSRQAQIQYRTDDRASYEHFIEVDTEFHVGIAQLTRNRLLVRAVADLRCQMERIMFAAIGIGYYGEVPAREHQEILDAILRREPELACKLMRSHIIRSKDKVLQLASGT